MALPSVTGCIVSLEDVANGLVLNALSPQLQESSSIDLAIADSKVNLSAM